MHAVAALLVCVNLSKNFCLRIRLEAKASAKVMGLSETCKYFEDIFSKIESIGYMPSAIGRARNDGTNTREAFIRGYRIVYQERDDHIWIIAVIHSSRLYPRPI